MGRLSHDYAAEVRRTLTDPQRLCERLGLGKDSQRSAGGVLVRCPAHDETTPSCSVTRGPDGTIRCRCFGCGWTGDALTLIAAVHGLDTRSEFREVLLEGAGIAGLHQAVQELSGEKPYEPRQAPAQPPIEPERDYPDAAEVRALWEAAGPASDDEDSAWHLEGRGIDARDASRLGLLRSVCLGTGLWVRLPDWARYRGQIWPERGFRLVAPVFDAAGLLRSLRAWRVTEGDGPKRLPPTGHRATGLVLANTHARKMLAGETKAPARIIVVEGEPDWVSVALRWPWCAVLGVFSGSWSEAFAARIPLGSEVIVRTHHDEAGERYAKDIVSTAKARAVVRRSAA